MAKQSLAAFGNTSSDFMTSFVVGEGKVGKTTFLVASCLGALPHQKKGLVDKPENLHLVGFDQAFADGLLRFLKESCKRGPEYLNLSVHPLTEVTAKASSGSGWDYGVYNATMAEIRAIQADVKKGGVHATIFSSLSGLAGGIKAGLAGSPDPSKKGSGMDQSKWDGMSHQLNALRNYAQGDDNQHIFWEGHIMKSSAAKEEDQKDENGIQGSAGKSWGFNVDSVLRLRREQSKYPGTAVDKVFMDTRPTLDFVSGGRGFNEALAPREYDLVEMAEKLGKRVGGFVGTSEPAKQAEPAK
mgnify:CR=1 FL=1